jgi:nicotinate phosphoribosyltransferase
MSFDSELEAFEAYAQVLPNNCVFLVDTYDTLDGVRHAIEVGKRLRQSGREMIGIRIDSGDLAYLSIEARKLLDDAGFPDAKILATNDLDEKIIESLKSQGAAIAVWGVGTRLVTGHDQPALGGVYKLGAIKSHDGTWQPKIKLSEQAAKTTIPGILQVRRFMDDKGFVADMIYDEIRNVDSRNTIVDMKDPTRTKNVPLDLVAKDLLVPFFRSGQLVSEPESIASVRRRVAEELAQLNPATQRFLNPHEYPVGLDIGLHEMRTSMMHQARKDAGLSQPR